MSKKVRLEGGCTANFDRSTMFEAVGKYMAQEMGVSQYVEISSSGTKASKIIRLASPMKIRHQVIGLGKESGKVYCPEDQEVIEAVLAAGPNAETNEENRILYARALQIVRGDGGRNRGYALGEKQIPLTEGSFQPTVKKDGLDFFLGMKQGNADDAQKIYGFDIGTIITTFQDFVQAKDPVPDPMGKGLIAYRETRDYFMEHCPTAIEKALDLKK